MSGHRRVCCMPLDDRIRVQHLVERPRRPCPTPRAGAEAISRMTRDQGGTIIAIDKIIRQSSEDEQ